MTTKLTFSLTITVLLFLVNAGAAEKARKIIVDASKLPPAATKQNVTYAKDIQPLFQASCVKCHGAERPKAKLRLDNLDGVLKGSEQGKVVVPGKSAESVLLVNVAQAGNPDDYMPPPGNKANIPPLTKEQVSLIRAWIDQGAK